jgi:hypothetical protein
VISSAHREGGFRLGLSDAFEEALATHSAGRRPRTVDAGNRGGWGKAVPRAYGVSATAVLAMVPWPLPPMVCLPVLGDRFIRHMRCEVAAPAGESPTGRLTGHFAPSGSVAGDRLRAFDGSIRMWRQAPRHDVSSLMMGAGGARGFRARLCTKTMVTIIRPPQRGQQQGSGRGAAVSVAGAACAGASRGVMASKSRALATMALRLPLASRP